jgi:small-conductance mechanosensitive channel
MERLRTPQVLKSDLYYDIFRVFAEHQIEIPFPQRDIHVRSIEAPLPIVRPHRAGRSQGGTNIT